MPDLHVRGVIPSDGRQRDLFIRDGLIRFDAGRDAKTILDGGYVIPGLVDAHAHLAFAGPAPDGPWEEKVRGNGRAQLEAGVLAIRDPGSPAQAGLGPPEGLPRIFVAGRFLCAPGRMFPEHGQVELPDEQLPAAAEEQLRFSGSWVKVVGDFPGPSGAVQPSFRPETLAEVARRVHAGGGRVAIHAFLSETIAAAIEAGFDSIEHGVMVEPDQLEAMAEKGIALVPTIVGDAWPDILTMFGASSEDVERASVAQQRHRNAARMAWEAGVRLLAGTDAGVIDHGLVRKEVAAFIEAGVPAIDALGAASWEARSFLGLPGLEEGAPADLVAYRTNPLEDVSSLAEPELIVLDGKVVRPAGRMPA